VRPDGYVGAVVPDGEVERLGAYMSDVGLSAREGNLRQSAKQ
jgi:hypothetical protein